MSDIYTVAKFWKCALQVNPSRYITYRGQNHGLSEEDYNTQLVKICEEEGIKIIGVADHCNVDAVDSIRSLMNEHDIIVFPGFEISSTEKVHFVCLFSEGTTKEQLHRYMGNLNLTDTESDVRPSDLGANELIQKVNDLGGFIYAAHITNGNGLLKQGLIHIWTNPLLRAVQIPGALEDVPEHYKRILLHKDPAYRRDRPIGIINAKDIVIPEDLKSSSASCLIKMTTPSFQSFKTAFLESESRIRLNSDIQEHFYSRIERISISGGFLDGIEINPFSDHLNAVIGGRGTGKSTLLECIRYVLDKQASGKEAQKKHDEIIKENLGKVNGRIEISVRSSAKNGQRFIISRKYPDPVTIKDESGNVSNYKVKDILPEVEIFGQNEILEIARNKDSLFQIIQRFLPVSIQDADSKIVEIQDKYKECISKLIKAEENLSQCQEKITQLPKFEEEAKQYEKLGIKAISNIVPGLERERNIFDIVQEKLKVILSAI
jgi:PHP family Zn ribbon phosphoesterase